MGANYWDAATRWSDYSVGFHYDNMHDTDLWAHEGYHAWSGDDSEMNANYYQANCPNV